VDTGVAAYSDQRTLCIKDSHNHIVISTQHSVYLHNVLCICIYIFFSSCAGYILSLDLYPHTHFDRFFDRIITLSYHYIH
jgi:hypothetical protein